MLDATIRKKIRDHLREITYDAKASNLALQQEDVITSTVFGPLRYMPSADAWNIVKKILLDEEAGDIHGLVPTGHHLEFWPSLPSQSRSHVEPDLLFEFSFENGTRRVIVLEVKWNSDLMENQLTDQSKSIEDLARKNKPVLYEHVFLARTLATKKAQEQIDETKCRHLTWQKFEEECRCLAVSNTWPSDAENFLRSIGEVPFESFSSHDSSVDQTVIPIIGEWALAATAPDWTCLLLNEARTDINPIAWRVDGWSFNNGITDVPHQFILSWRVES